MKTKNGSGGETPPSFNVDAWLIVTIRPLCFQEWSPIPTGLEAEWAPEEFWTCLDMRISFLAWIRTPFRPARSLVPTRPMLTRSVTHPNTDIIIAQPADFYVPRLHKSKDSCNVLYLYIHEHTLFKQIKTYSTFPHFPAQLTLVGVSVRTADMQTGTTGKWTGSLFRPRTRNGLRDNNHTI